MRVSPLRARRFKGEPRTGEDAVLDGGRCATPYTTSLHDESLLNELISDYSLDGQVCQITECGPGRSQLQRWIRNEERPSMPESRLPGFDEDK